MLKLADLLTKFVILRKVVASLRNRFLVAKFERQMTEINKTGDLEGARICFLDLFPVHYQFTKETIKKLALSHHVVVLILDKAHPLYRNKADLKNIHVFLIDIRWIAFALKWLRIPYLVTPASHLHPTAIRPDLNVVHTYHSLVSMHAVYGDDAFDAYTHFFACGPHHAREVAAIKSARGLPPAAVYDVGYPKLDELAINFVDRTKTPSTQKTVLLAPSWHPENLLATHGEEMCLSILELGHKIIVRPHPHLYERDVATMALLNDLAAKHTGQITIENPNKEFRSFWCADLMVSDWSGVAFEYAFATERPVVFVDTPRKMNSTGLLNIGIPTIEDILRTRVGVVVANVPGLPTGISTALSLSSDQWVKKIRAVRREYIYNYLTSADVGSRILAELADGAEMLQPTETSRERLFELIAHYS